MGSCFSSLIIGTWVDVADAVYGYNQVNVTASVYLPDISFEPVPEEVPQVSITMK